MTWIKIKGKFSHPKTGRERCNIREQYIYYFVRYFVVISRFCFWWCLKYCFYSVFHTIKRKIMKPKKEKRWWNCGYIQHKTWKCLFLLNVQFLLLLFSCYFFLRLPHPSGHTVASGDGHRLVLPIPTTVFTKSESVFIVHKAPAQCLSSVYYGA